MDSQESGHTIGNDSMVKRNRAIRFLVFVISLGVIVLLSTIIGSVVAGFYGFFGGMVIGLIIFGKISPKFVVTVPQSQAFVTVNPALALFNIPGDPNIIYGPGTALCLPIESRSAHGNVSLEIITISFFEEVPGANAKLIVSGSLQFHVDITRANKFVGINDSTVRGGMINLILSQISQTLATKTGDEAKAEIGQYNANLFGFFGLGDPSSRDVRVSNFEGRYGIITDAITITGIDFSPEVQATRDARDRGAQVFLGVAGMMGRTEEQLRADMQSGKVTEETYAEYVNRFLALSGVGTIATINSPRGGRTINVVDTGGGHGH